MPQKREKEVAQKEVAKKPSTRKKQAEREIITNNEEEKEIISEEEKAGDFISPQLIALSEKDKLLLKKVKSVIDSKINDLVSEILGVFNLVISKTYIRDESNNLVLDKRGNPIQNWDNITISDIKTVILKIPILQLRLSSIEVDTWAEAEFAKLLKEEIYEKTYFEAKTGTDSARKNVAYLSSLESNYRAFFLKYANKRISSLNESLSRITDKWSRAIELLRLEMNLK